MSAVRIGDGIGGGDDYHELNDSYGAFILRSVSFSYLIFTLIWIRFVRRIYDLMIDTVLLE